MTESYIDFLIFLKNEGVDFKGRSLSEIWNYTDIQIEQNHDFIQVVFPLNKPSSNAFHGFYLSDQSEILKLQNSETIKSNLITLNGNMHMLEHKNYL